MIDVIIPTIPGREASLGRCKASYGAHNVIVVEDSESCGWGWTRGLERSEAPYVLLACDDQELVSDLDVCIKTVEEGFIPCPRVWTPHGMIESNGGDMNAHAHLINRPQKDRTPVDYTTVPFLKREWADEIGMLEECHYCTDVWVSYRARQLGIETILRHGYEVIHHQEQVGRGAGMTQGARDAMDEMKMREELERCESSSPVASAR